MFDAKKVKEDCVDWIREWFEKNGKGCNAIVGISGGLDSAVVAALCVEALGRERVIGVLMPQGVQRDIWFADELCRHLNIKNYEVNIGECVSALKCAVSIPNKIRSTEQAETNLPARIRMATLYYVAQCLNGRVANTCNLSEDWVGYSTRYGDSAGDFSPLSDILKTEVKMMAAELGLPRILIDKSPSDGLCGKTDEENLGFSYETLDEYILTGEYDVPEEAINRIDELHEKNKFKLELMPKFIYR